MKTLIIALGGNALIKKGQRGTSAEQLENLREPFESIVDLSNEYKVVITHGNGPQVGSILLQQASTNEVPHMPLDVCGAQSQGQIGYMIEHTLDQVLTNRGIGDESLFLTVLTYVKVDPDDLAFKNPTKPVGPTYSEEEAGALPYTMKKTAKGWRRVVPSPKPVTIYQKREIKHLIDNGFIVICCGGGGIPVTKVDGKISGIEGVIDKDLASAKLGEEIEANTLLIATDVEKVSLNYGKENQKDLDKITIGEAKEYMVQGHFPPGSMKPKVQAAINFLESGGERAIITRLEKIKEAIEGTAGTQIVK